MRAILYARVSTTDKQDPEMQLAELREYAFRRGWELGGTFVDRTSGTRESRPALEAWIFGKTFHHTNPGWSPEYFLTR